MATKVTQTKDGLTLYADDSVVVDGLTPLPKVTVITNKKFVIAFDSIMDVPNVFVDGKDVSKVDGNNLGISDFLIQWNTNTNVEGDKLLFIRSLTKGSDSGGVIENTIKETNVDEYL